MRFLLDTHLLLWGSFTQQLGRHMPTEAASLIDDRRNTLFFSVSSIWETAIKFSRGRPDFRIDPLILKDGLLDAGYIELAITSQHAAAVVELPPIHGDPFDRLLVAQATVEGLTLLTADKRLAEYPGPIQLIRR